MPRSDQNSLRRVTAADVRRLGDRIGLSLSDEEAADYRELVNTALESFDAIDDRPEPRLPNRDREHTDRPAARRPDPGEDPLNAWITRFELRGADDGPLSDLEVGLKDTIALRGYPLTLGSKVLEEFVPSIDATVATRLLDGGATIVGKQNMEAFAFSGAGDMSDFGPVVNPHDEAYLAGGSSGGSAAAVAAGDCDVSIGGDQAGSIRIPSACCGVVGLKPTTGLVPYTGVAPLELGIDHVGPIAASVEDVARVLEVVAGEDSQDGVGLDPRQPSGVESEEYTADLEAGVDDVTVGVLENGFDWEFADPGVVDAVRDSVDVLESAGATAESTTLEYHDLLLSAAGVVAVQGGARRFRDGGTGLGYPEWNWTEFAAAIDAIVDSAMDDLPPAVKESLLAAEHLQDLRGSTLYAKAWNVAREGRRQYDELLGEYDALLMPTVAALPLERDDDLDRVTMTGREWLFAANTAPTNLTGHPAISVPCAKRDGLPVGTMLVGARFDEETVLRVARAFEREADWESR